MQTYMQYYSVIKSEYYPGFFFIRKESFMALDSFLRKDGSISCSYGEGEDPTKMIGLWDNKEEAKKFLEEMDIQIAEEMVEDRNVERKSMKDFIDKAFDDNLDYEITKIRNIIGDSKKRDEQAKREIGCEHNFQYDFSTSHEHVYVCTKCGAKDYR